MLPWAIACAVCVAFLLVAEWRESPLGRWCIKPLASTCFLAAAFVVGAMDTLYGRLILTALALCWLGDLLLIPRRKGTFLVGLFAFLFGHLAYCTAFVVRGVDVAWAAVAVAVLVLVDGLVLRVLLRHVEPRMKLPVVLYVLVISTMATLAAGTVGALGAPLVLAGATSFLVSDMVVARDRFVRPGFANQAILLPLYYGAQLMLASTV